MLARIRSKYQRLQKYRQYFIVRKEKVRIPMFIKIGPEFQGLNR